MKQTEVPGYYKASEGVIVNRDGDSLKAYKLQKMKNAQINSMEEKINKLESDISEIKELLKGLVK